MMANLYVWFETAEQRRAFVMHMLSIADIVPRNGSKTAAREAEKQRQELQECLGCLDAGATHSPYYRLYRNYYMNQVPATIDRRRLQPWHPLAVYEKGFRQIYTQRRYCHRPGHWLVLDFRRSKAGWAMRCWVESSVPVEDLGTNVPLPEGVRARWYLEYADRVLEKSALAREALDELLAGLINVKAAYPDLFSGSSVYAWERLAFQFFGRGDLKTAAFCLRQQAELQPKSSEAYLNLGSFYMAEGRIGEAVNAFTAGLRIEPDDEFLAHNLAAAYAELGSIRQAARSANDAVLANPERGLNHKLKADLHCKQGQWHAGLAHYRYAAERIDDEGWSAIKAECYDGIAAIQRHFGAVREAERAEKLAERCRTTDATE